MGSARGTCGGQDRRRCTLLRFGGGPPVDRCEPAPQSTAHAWRKSPGLVRSSVCWRSRPKSAAHQTTWGWHGPPGPRATTSRPASGLATRGSPPARLKRWPTVWRSRSTCQAKRQRHSQPAGRGRRGPPAAAGRRPVFAPGRRHRLRRTCSGETVTASDRKHRCTCNTEEHVAHDQGHTACRVDGGG